MPLPSGLSYGSNSTRSNVKPAMTAKCAEALQITSREGTCRNFPELSFAHMMTFRTCRPTPICFQTPNRLAASPAAIERSRRRRCGSRVAERAPGPAHGRVLGTGSSSRRRSRHAACGDGAAGAIGAGRHNGGPRKERPGLRAGPHRTPWGRWAGSEDGAQREGGTWVLRRENSGEEGGRSDSDLRQRRGPGGAASRPRVRCATRDA